MENEMTVAKAASALEDIECTLARSRAIYDEANEYFQTTDKSKLALLPIYSKHILLLLDGADELASTAADKLREVADALYLIAKQEATAND